MDLKYRRLIAYFFIIIFLASSPVVIFLAKGYRYNFTKGTVEKTGVLFLETKPQEVQTYLNDKYQETGRVNRIKHLIPNEYDVKIKKEGFQTWQKKITIKPDETTFVQYVRLFKEDPKIENILEKNIILTSETNGDDVALVYTEEDKKSNLKKIKLAIFNLINSNFKELVTLKYQPEKIILSPNKKFILLGYGSQYANSQWLLNLDSQQLIDLKRYTSERVKNIKWYKNSDDDIYFISSRGFERFNLNNLEKSLISPINILDFCISKNSILSGDSVYFLTKNSQNVLLNQASLNNITEFETITTLPISNNYEFIKNSPDNTVTLIDKNNNILYLFNTKEKVIENKILIFSKTNFAKWKDEMLLFGNDYELLSYDLKKVQKNQIIRLSEKISNPTWYPIVTHVLFMVDGNLKIIEGVEDGRFLNVLIKDKYILKIFTTDEENKVYYLNKNGIFVAEIQ